MRHILFIISFFAVLAVRAQSLAPFEARPLTEAVNVAKKGTYQVILKPGAVKEDLSYDLLVEIEKKRAAENTTYMQLKENVKVRIFPLSEIQSESFKPYEEYVYEE